MLAKSLCLPDITKPCWETKLTALMRSVGLTTAGKAYQLKASAREGRGGRRSSERVVCTPVPICAGTPLLSHHHPQAPDFKVRILTHTPRLCT